MPTPSTIEDTPAPELSSIHYTTCPPEEVRQDGLVRANGEDLINGDQVEPGRTSPAVGQVTRPETAATTASLSTPLQEKDADTQMTEVSHRSATPDVTAGQESDSQSPTPASPMPTTSFPPTLQRPETPIHKVDSPGVSCIIRRVTNSMDRSYQSTLLPTYGMAANSGGLKSRIARYITCPWKLNMST